MTSETTGYYPSPEQRAAFLEQLRVFLATMYPQGGYRTHRRLVERAKNRGHYGSLGQVARILVDAFIRHEQTNYVYLLRCNGPNEGLTREEARMVVADEVADITAIWRRGSAETDAGYVQLRDQLRRQRPEGRPDIATIASENEAVADYLGERRRLQRAAKREARAAAVSEATAMPGAEESADEA